MSDTNEPFFTRQTTLSSLQDDDTAKVWVGSCYDGAHLAAAKLIPNGCSRRVWLRVTKNVDLDLALVEAFFRKPTHDDKPGFSVPSATVH